MQSWLEAAGILCLGTVGVAIAGDGYAMGHIATVPFKVASMHAKTAGARTLVYLSGADSSSQAIIDVSRPSKPVVFAVSGNTNLSKRLAAGDSFIGSQTADDPERELKYIVNETGFWVISYRDLDRERERIAATQALYAP